MVAFNSPLSIPVTAAAIAAEEGAVTMVQIATRTTDQVVAVLEGENVVALPAGMAEVATQEASMPTWQIA